MVVTVRVKANARHDESVALVDDHVLQVTVKAPARDGLANAAVCKLVARYFGVAPSLVTVSRGHTAKTKMLIVDDGRTQR